MGTPALFAPVLFAPAFFAPGFQPSLIAVSKTRPVEPGCYAAAPLALVAVMPLALDAIAPLALDGRDAARWMDGMPWRWMDGPASYAAYKLGRAVVPLAPPPEAAASRRTGPRPVPEEREVFGKGKLFRELLVVRDRPKYPFSVQKSITKNIFAKKTGVFAMAVL